MNYYDANTVANESYKERYGGGEPQTLCDCGEVAEAGEVYCSLCMEDGNSIMQEAVQQIVSQCNFTAEQAEEFMVYWLENKDKFEVAGWNH